MAAQDEQIQKIRHSLAHIMAAAIQHLWPEAKFGVGPVVENGFYYDIDIEGTRISEEDFPKIESEMKKIIKANQKFKKTEKTPDEAIQWARQAKQPYKEELLNDLKRAGTTAAKDIDSKELGLNAKGGSKVNEVSFYTSGDFTDLCRGPHVESTGQTGAFKLMRVAGAYWRGKENNPQMQRLYGVAFKTKDELKKHLALLKEAEKRDHRKLGHELDLYVVSDLVGSGLPLFTPRGTVLRGQLIRYSQELRSEHGFESVWIPHIAKKELYLQSGHWDKFGDELFLVKSQETSDEFVLKSMNCPHHAQIFASRQRSYRELPVKYMENTTIYRDEKSGELHGLERVRSVTQDDCHVFCTEGQINDSIQQLIQATQDLYKTLDMPIKRTHLSFRDDNDAYLGDKGLWQNAQNTLEDLAKKSNLEYEIDEGEAAFYGPKIDFIAEDAIGRETQVATIQLDFVQPQRFKLEYINENGEAKQPVMIHAALLGSVERFLSVYIEHTAGRFPVWLAPEQVRVITVNQEHKTNKFADSILAVAKELGVRTTLDNDNESVGKKIRKTETAKVPYALIIGEKEMNSRMVTPRIRKDLEVLPAHPELTIEDFFKTVANESKSRANKSSI